MKNLITLVGCIFFFSATIYAQEVSVCPSSITCNGTLCTRPDNLSGTWKCAHRPRPGFRSERIVLPWVGTYIRYLNHATCEYASDDGWVQCVARVNHSPIYPGNWSGGDNSICTVGPRECAMVSRRIETEITVERGGAFRQLD
jgi:hypothetical protein